HYPTNQYGPEDFPEYADHKEMFEPHQYSSFSYAPRFKNLEHQRLYIFRSRKGSDRSAWKIKPAGYADEIVIQQWDEILRLIATIKLKEVTASDLFRRLNSYSKQQAEKEDQEMAEACKR